MLLAPLTDAGNQEKNAGRTRSCVHCQPIKAPQKTPDEDVLALLK
jgi:hypothetical protein